MVGAIGGLYWTTASDIDDIAEPHDVIFKVGDSNVYDGDTIQRIYISVYDIDPRSEIKDFPAEHAFPMIYIEKDNVYCYADIRIKGIDTPEKKPATAGRTEESRQAEKDAAKAATGALYNLLAFYDFQFQIEDVEEDKYFGRIVADVFVGEGADRINVGDYMIEQGYAYAYDGGTKKEWDSGWFEIDIE